MSVLFEEWNPQAVDAALQTGPYHPRITLHIQTPAQTWRFIRDTQERVIDGNTYLRLQYLQASAIESSEGDIADRVDLTLDGRDLVFEDGVDADAVTAFSAVLEESLRGAPTQIGLVMLDPETMEPVGLKADFVGYFEGAELDMEQGAVLTGSVLSQETWFHQRVPEVYMDVSHRQIHPGDTSFKHVSDVVRRQGNTIWNGRESGTQGTSNYTPGGSPYNPYGPIDFNLR